MPTKRRASRSRKPTKPTKRRRTASRKPTKRRTSSRSRKPATRVSKRRTSRKPAKRATKRAVRRRVGHIERPSTATRIGRSIPVYQVGVRGKPFYMRAGRRVDVTRYIKS
jgi:hypothetical protein